MVSLCSQVASNSNVFLSLQIPLHQVSECQEYIGGVYCQALSVLLRDVKVNKGRLEMGQLPEESLH